MKILYCSYSQVPSDFANSIAVMKQCGALSKVTKLKVILIKGDSSEKKDVFSVYGVERFSLILLPKWMLCFRELGLKVLVLLYALTYRPDVVYSRDILLNEWLCWFRIRNIYEIHQLDQVDAGFDHLYKKILSRIMRRCELQAVVSISDSLAGECVDFGVPGEKLTVMHSGVDLRECEDVPEMEMPDFPHDRPLAVYVGSLQKGKGVDRILQMAEASSDYNFLIVGGAPEEIREMKNLRHIPKVTHDRALAYMREADFLLLPLTEQVYKFHSPLKLFEYLSMGKPVIASNNADIREIMSHLENGMLADPELLGDFLEKMDQVRGQQQLRERLEENARQTAAQFTWEVRAEKIICLIRRLRNAEK